MFVNYVSWSIDSSVTNKFFFFSMLSAFVIFVNFNIVDIILQL